MNFKVLMEACRDWHVVFGVVSISLTTAQYDIGVDLLGCSLLVRLAAVLNQTRLIENGLMAFFRLIGSFS